ncbi:MAG: hypothetical protein KDD56_04135 [Bdellovibrionales bacterium]|nr:hypothetical protein [Bdellovibrionales bacterium]
MNSQSKIPGIKDALLLNAYSFCLLAGYYQVKPISRTLFVETAGAKNLPFLWLGSALVLSLLIPIIQWGFKNFPPLKVLAGSTISFSLLLFFLWVLLANATLTNSIFFYILIDIFIVILVENFWSVNNIVFKNSEGKKWYGFIASGSTLGAIAGSAIAAKYLQLNNTTTLDLIFIAIFFFICSLILAQIGFKTSIWSKTEQLNKEKEIDNDSLKKSLKIPAVKLLICLSLISQVIEPLVEYLFLQNVENSILGLKERTQYIANVFTLISSLALFINLTILPLMLKKIGLWTSLILQPLIIMIAAVFNSTSNSLTSNSMLKIIDRGFSYSIGRAAKELLYLDQGSKLVYLMKPWIDMFGYRTFKILGALLILFLSSALTFRWLSVLIVLICLFWIISIVIFKLSSKSK